MATKHLDDCALCAAIDPSLTNVENARRLDTSESTIRRHLGFKTPVTDPFFTEIPVSAITSRRTTRRLVDGSYERVTYDPKRIALAQLRQFDDIERAIAGFEFTPPAATKDRTGTLHVCAADLQVGKVDALGGTDELLERVFSSLYAAADRAKRDKPEQIVLWDLGDIIENFTNTNQQRETNDLDLVTQIRVARRILVEAIKLLAPLAPELVFASVPSNHCQVRTGLGNKAAASNSDNDFGLEINTQVQDVFEGRQEFSNVVFVRPQSLSEALTVTTGDGTVIGAVHGHQGRSQDKMGEWWKGQSHGRRDNLHNADILLYGHFHNMRVQHSGDARWLIGAPTSDNGSTWFSAKSGETSKNGMLVFTTRRGQWAHLEIL